jgi:hypothetical protein
MSSGFSCCRAQKRGPGRPRGRVSGLASPHDLLISDFSCHATPSAAVSPLIHCRLRRAQNWLCVLGLGHPLRCVGMLPGHSKGLNGKPASQRHQERRANEVFHTQIRLRKKGRHSSYIFFCCLLESWPSGQNSLLEVQRSRVRFPALRDFLRSSASGTGSNKPREYN